MAESRGLQSRQPARNDVEARFRIDPVARFFIAGGAQIGDCRGHVEIGHGRRPGSPESGDIARVIGDADRRASAANRGNADALVDNQVAFPGATGQRQAKGKRGKKTVTDGHAAKFPFAVIRNRSPAGCGMP